MCQSRLQQTTNLATIFRKNMVWHYMRIVCQQKILMKYHAVFIIMFYVQSPFSCAKATTCYPTLKQQQQVACKGGFDLGHHAVLETSPFFLRLIILTDRLGPDQARQNVKCFIHNKGADKNVRYAGWSATLLVSYISRGTYIYRRVVWIYVEFISRSLLF